MICYQDFGYLQDLRAFVDRRDDISIISIETLCTAQYLQTFRVWYKQT